MLVSHQDAGHWLAALLCQFVARDDEPAYLSLAEGFADVEDAAVGELVVAQVKVRDVFTSVLFEQLANLHAVVVREA